MRFHPYSVARELRPGTDYAGVFICRDTGAPVGPPRPVRVRCAENIHGYELVADPVDAPDEWVAETDPRYELHILGGWDGPIYPLRRPPFDEGLGRLSQQGMTWRQYADLHVGEVLRQRELAQRMRDYGLDRRPEAYLAHRNQHNAVSRGLALNYDELDQLLRAAGF